MVHPPISNLVKRDAVFLARLVDGLDGIPGVVFEVAKEVRSRWISALLFVISSVTAGPTHRSRYILPTALLAENRPPSSSTDSFMPFHFGVKRPPGQKMASEYVCLERRETENEVRTSDRVEANVIYTKSPQNWDQLSLGGSVDHVVGSLVKCGADVALERADGADFGDLVPNMMVSSRFHHCLSLKAHLGSGEVGDGENLEFAFLV